jgi:hypothetical protein
VPPLFGQSDSGIDSSFRGNTERRGPALSGFLRAFQALNPINQPLNLSDLSENRYVLIHRPRLDRNIEAK